ncbi:MAG: CRISPR system precrRNA processing endoribonuclease RAMP protein Cas6 [Rhodoferax sp.]|nr:CRISPR system precrRNA processing endoribonuclease RAMP protein Cas6 [Rhodoferax sp.]
MTVWRVARYRFTAIVQQPLALPEYAGSLLRGQFGAALRNVACMTRQPTCPGCPLLQTCPYTRIFEAPPPAKGQHALQDFSQIPNPYVIEPPTPGARVLDADDTLVFNLVLVGHAIDQLTLVVFALQRALAQGLTRQRIPADLLRVDWIDAQGTPQPVWTHDQPTLAEHPTALQAPATPVNIDNGITLHIHTPLRLQQQGQPLGVAQLTPRALVAALARRSALLMEFHAGQSGWGETAKQITHQSESLTDTRDLHWFDWTRYSSRQQQEMTLGGVLGRWSLHGSSETLAALWPWLWLGQWLHVGKNATMGLGGYTLEV